MNKQVLITGGSRGIGAATARYLAGQGYHLCLNYRHDRASAEALVAEIRARHPVSCIAVQADVSVETEVVRLFEVITEDELAAMTPKSAPVTDDKASGG